MKRFRAFLQSPLLWAAVLIFGFAGWLTWRSHHTRIQQLVETRLHSAKTIPITFRVPRKWMVEENESRVALYNDDRYAINGIYLYFHLYDEKEYLQGFASIRERQYDDIARREMLTEQAILYESQGEIIPQYPLIEEDGELFEDTEARKIFYMQVIQPPRPAIMVNDSEVTWMEVKYAVVDNPGWLSFSPDYVIQMARPVESGILEANINCYGGSRPECEREVRHIMRTVVFAPSE